MLTIKPNTTANWTVKPTRTIAFNPVKSYLKYADSQKGNHTLWWFVNLMVHGNLVLAVPAVLIYYYHAPVIILGITVIGFFGNLVANMCGAGIRVTLTAFFASLLINMAMLLIFIL
ncbi:hypothetical protein EWM62_16390 [Mucilaginibacter terrigena]|uniref:Uncharacterized protein n=1 Tax=Mucilaginibacter terrigena TaxID=2492395 RepID=A0A4V1ZBH0_9SPHI|nr:hypothetical protein [Mucilaginibacter terrigena]RYU87290.1 hypothetical protein EWM62_16390 [Mucilaginibacter terrigena]